ncbi:UvrD-helicase domain-containing protein [Glycomyces niveus]|uniref:DNA 3'-5' helicase n=1 Tax=Glycomyces niveus TaxID=2820287 RepID=A0ABS3U9L6_9ACTN|nr:UvrD-helicase domain-containing protein [Glycomyces sp. NEAU-S30]MBO3735471.1 UvrD-helicase domain-containing protein [Glycomyces sp. NEAU-S30]
MAERESALLTVESNAIRHLDSLDRGVRTRFEDFQSKFCWNMHTPGLRLKPLKGHKGLWSARITDDYRAIMCKVGHAHFALIAVLPRGEVYERIEERWDMPVNRVTGALEVVDHSDIRAAISDAKRPVEAPMAPAAVKPETAAKPGLFDPFTTAELIGLGVAEPLMPSIREIRTDQQLIDFIGVAPRLTGEILFALNDGQSLQQVEELVTAPVKIDEPVDTGDLQTAIERPAAMVTSSDRAVAAMLDGGFAAWRVWPHPAQRKIIVRRYNGPARVSGGPGTGKTVVALHRAARLARELDPSEGRILLTTFTKNLAADLDTKLSMLVEGDERKHVDVEHLDRVVHRLAVEGGRKLGKLLGDKELRQWWEELRLERGETEFDAEFLYGEWTEVICAQLLTSRAEYFKARRVKRPRRLDRGKRALVWELVERFNARLAEENAWCWPQLRASVAIAEENRSAGGGHRYRHIVVDEAQDLTPAHWRLLRALAPESTDDLFIAGDTFQRIYGQPVTLGKLGVSIVGRSSRLTLNYRTTREILRTALAIEADAVADDLDGDLDSLAGYRSVMSGEKPAFRPQRDAAAELDEIVRQVQAWTADCSPGSIAVTAPRTGAVADIIAALNAAGVPAGTLSKDRQLGEDLVHVGTMHGLKGLEYRYLIISGIGADGFPFPYIRRLADTDPQRYELELEKARNLLFVATTRARDEVVFTWTGEPSPLLHLAAGE